MSADLFDARTFLKTLTSRPGVYRMLDAAGEILYVGKARDLKKRVSNYFTRSNDSPKTASLVAQIQGIEVTVTETESEALILENNLIKQHRPRYNVLLRDDKSYPYIHLTTDDSFPRMLFHRGARTGKGRYFGPYPSAGAVRDSLSLLQKIFRVRQCEDSFFRNRSRPCLQYQIDRCTAPCVDLVETAAYRQDVHFVEQFLEGHGQAVIDELVVRMESASQDLEFETAARCRDQIASLRRVQERQSVSSEGGDHDIIAAVQNAGVSCITVFFVRAGNNLGNKVFFPKVPDGATPETVMAAFLPQYYLGRPVPQEILLNCDIPDRDWLGGALTEQAGHKVVIKARLRGERARWLRMAITNAEQALATRLASRAGMVQRLEALRDLLALDELPGRMECFDISHTSGEATVASCVVFDAEGPLKSDYRRFNIDGVTGGDDFAAMAQALNRRYLRLKKGEARLPDILFIDGGKGQLGVARDILAQLQIDSVMLVGVAKGSDRKAGLEQLFLSDSKIPVLLPADSPALHLIQQIRDEAHRFAITGHRQRRARARKQSPLETIPGMGPKRRQVLLKQFGGLREVERAGVEDLANVPGISKQLANRIYAALHPKNC